MSSSKGPRPASQKVVKVGMLQEELNKFGQFLLHEVARKMQDVDNQYYSPRLEALEWAVKPWWKKIWLRLTVGTWIGDLGKKKKEPQEDGQERAPGPNQEAGPDNPEDEAAVAQGFPRPVTPPEAAQPAEEPTEEKTTRTCAQCMRPFIIHGPERICPICVLEDDQ